MTYTPKCFGDNGRCGATPPKFAHTEACLAEHEATINPQPIRRNRERWEALGYAIFMTILTGIGVWSLASFFRGH